MHNLVIAQTNFPSLSSREYRPHRSLTASTSISPRPHSASSLASVRTGGAADRADGRINPCDLYACREGLGRHVGAAPL